MGIEIDELCSASKWEATREEWDMLLHTSDEDDIFLSYEWLRSWWDIYGEGRKLHIITARDDGELVGAAPLMVSTLGKIVKFRIIEFVGTGPSDRLAALAKKGREEVLGSIWKHLEKECKWDVLDLRDVREGESTARALRSSFPSAEIETSVDPYIPLVGSYEDYVKGLSSNFRHNIVRSWKRLTDDHSARLEILGSPGEMERGFKTLLGLNALRWKDIGTSTLESEQMRQFLDKALRALSPKGQVVFHVLLASDMAISVTLGFHYSGRYLYYLSGFNPEFHNYGPGRSLLAKIVEDSYSRGLTEMDLLRGGEDYKFKFNPKERNLLRVRTSGKGFKGSLSDVIIK